MKLYKTSAGNAIFHNEQFFLSPEKDWDTLINQADLHSVLLAQTEQEPPLGAWEWLASQTVFSPIGQQEIWAAGVTYLRSKIARMEESKDSGGDTFYDKVYSAERPEVFFKGTAIRAVGDQGTVYIREDSTWDVPEPELTLFVNSANQIAAYTIGNDMSSRSIEGENPLYLPQAKVYDNCAGLGPCLYISEEPIPLTTPIRMNIVRAGEVIFEGDTQVAQMKRSLPELVEYLTRECHFPLGVFLMTGTCIVPDPPFTLAYGDEINITIDPIGTLKNTVRQRPIV
jgi:2-dehydro-3-deoxy-D-arabinonate dehydratase